MTIESRASSDGRKVTIDIRGRFDFSQISQFRSSYESKNKDAEFVVDLRQTEHIDSSALGMLLNMRTFLGGDTAQISIVNCSPGIKKIFEISRFDKKFSIS
ncbi:anti-anti-sigma factor [Hahella sp. CCB-MM4]|uniref:STAS domain-containing protein n=1 Tax=Hahella sp. (strain CCB-MM4) TaxID=1926491 RepID=UPI000B9ADF9A|nr:STAS domain-containing protein [Hahella sp. CCB-MM4]OZG75294.1 anti-anti-sigma factor [Hahella sp. CCB-MM4]